MTSINNGKLEVRVTGWADGMTSQQILYNGETVWLNVDVGVPMPNVLEHIADAMRRAAVTVQNERTG